MSLTAHLLFRRETILPKGRVVLHNADTRQRSLTKGEQDQAARNRSTRLGNIERVYNVIADSKRPVTMLDIEIATGLSRITVLNACEELENTDGGPPNNPQPRAKTHVPSC